MKLKNKNIRIFSPATIAVIAILTLAGFFFASCSSNNLSGNPLTEFIYYAEEYGLPTEYLKLINENISLQYRARPAYSNNTVYLTDSFDSEGNFMQFYDMDSFEISSVYHECFHAYIDLVIRKGLCSSKEEESFKKTMEDSLTYYTRTADGRKILWHNYRRQSSEEAMAIHVTNCVKYKIVYEKIAERIASDYIYDLIDAEQMEEKLKEVNIKWSNILEGKRSRGYYNKSFLRWKFHHIIDAKNYISDDEKSFVAEYILPGLQSEIKKPPLTEFIKTAKKNGLPYVYLIDVNKNYLWEKNFRLKSYDKLSAEEIGEIYGEAFNIYWDKVLLRGRGARISENEAFIKTVELSSRWYSGSTEDRDSIYEITRNAAKSYISEIIRQKVLWQNYINNILYGNEELDDKEFKKTWRNAIEGRNIYGFYTEGNRVFKALNAMSLEEKEFILNFILTDINYSFGSLLSVEPVPAENEIVAGARAEAHLIH